MAIMARKQNNSLELERQKANMNTFVDSVKLLSDHPDLHVNSFDILAANDELYMNLGSKALERMPQDDSYHSTFYEHCEDHLVDLDEVNKYITIETRRTNYTHRVKSKSNKELVNKIKSKKRDIKVQSDKDLPVEDVEMADSKEEQKELSEGVNDQVANIDLYDAEPEKQVNKKNIKRKEHQRDQIMLMLVYHKSKHNDFGNSVSIFVESGYSLGLLRRISYSNTKIIGLKEYNLIQLEKESLAFPTDYPATKTYQDMLEVKSKQKFLEYCRKPPKKRINFSKINSPYAFKPNWQLFSKDLSQI
jgi:hypothetical protein